MRDDMLEGGTCLSRTDGTQEGFEIATGQPRETRRRLLVAQVRQKFRRCPAMVRARRARESTDLLQIGRVGRNALLEAAHRSWWIQRQLGVEIPIQLTHQRREIGISLRIRWRTGQQPSACEAAQAPHTALL